MKARKVSKKLKPRKARTKIMARRTRKKRRHVRCVKTEGKKGMQKNEGT